MASATSLRITSPLAASSSPVRGAMTSRMGAKPRTRGPMASFLLIL